MTRLIDADRLPRVSVDTTDIPTDKCLDFVLWVDIEDARTVDAVPVVRCKDCKHQDSSETVTADTTLCMEFIEIVDMDGFCYKGERREDGEE